MPILAVNIGFFYLGMPCDWLDKLFRSVKLLSVGNCGQSGIRGEVVTFRGATLVNLDSKGRLSVPTCYREQLLENAAGQMVCTIDIHHPCLPFLPPPEWGIIEQKLRVCRRTRLERRAAPTVRSCQRMSDGWRRSIVNRASTAGNMPG